MPTEDAYSSRHLILSHLGFANVPLLRPLTLNHTLHQFMTPFPDLTFYRLWRYYLIQVSIGHLRRVWHADRGRLLLWTPGPVPLWDLQVFKCCFWHSSMTKAPTPTKSKNATRQHKKRHNTFDYTTIADRLRTVSCSNNNHSTGVVNPVYGIHIFPLTEEAV